MKEASQIWRGLVTHTNESFHTCLTLHAQQIHGRIYVYAHVYMHKCRYGYTIICIYMHIYIPVLVCVCVCVCVYICVFVSECAHARVRVCMVVHVCAYTYVYIYIYISTYLYIYIRIHIDNFMDIYTFSSINFERHASQQCDRETLWISLRTLTQSRLQDTWRISRLQESHAAETVSSVSPRLLCLRKCLLWGGYDS